MQDEPQAIDVIGLISRSPWFEALDESARQALANTAQVRYYDKSTFVYRIGEKTSTIFCVAPGR